jgi:hypothetical protein
VGLEIQITLRIPEAFHWGFSILTGKIFAESFAMLQRENNEEDITITMMNTMMMIITTTMLVIRKNLRRLQKAGYI